MTQARGPRALVLALGAVAFFASAPGQSFLISVFVDDLLADTGLSRSTFSALYAAGTVVSALSMLLVGRLVDRFHLRVVWVVVSTALAAACLLAGSAVGAITAFLAMAFLRTFGQGSFTLLGTLLVARSFQGRRGGAMAVVSLGVTTASIVLPPAVATLILATDWRTAYRVIAAVLVVVVLPLAVLIRVPRPEPTPAEEVPVPGRDLGVSMRRLGGRELAVPSATAARLLIVLAAPPLIGTALTFHAVSILAEQGLDYIEAGVCLGLLGAFSAVGTILAGVLTDRLSSRAALLGLASAVTVAPLLLLPERASVAYVAFGVLGLGMGATGVVNGTIWARTYGLTGLGRLQGTAQSSMITAAAVAPLVPALGRTDALGYAPSFALLAALGLLAVVVALGVRPRPDLDPTLT